MSTEQDKAVETIKEAQKSKEESELVNQEENQQPLSEVPENEDVVAEDQEDDDSDLTEEEKAKIDKVIGLVNDRCFIMHHCLEGALGIVIDCVEDTLSEDKRVQSMDLQNFSQYSSMPPDLGKAHILSSAAMLATKLYESIVPSPKQKR